MSGLSGTVWREFGVEAEEHLHLIEPLLVGAAEGLSAADIAQLFRSFHSLKGLGRTLSLSGIETVAHQAENILGVVRDGDARIDDVLAGLLLEALDEIKGLVQAATSTHADSQPRDDLVRRLEKAYEMIGGAPAPEAAPAAPEPGPEPIEPAVPSEDAEMLAFFAESLAENLPLLARAIEIPTAPAAAEAREGAEIIANGAEVMGFALLQENAEAAVALLAGQLSEEGRERLRVLLDDIAEQAAVVAELAGIAGPPKAAEETREPAELGFLLAAQVDFEESVAAGLDPDSGRLATAAHEAFRAVMGSGRPALGEMLLFLVDICRRAERGAQEITPALALAFRAIVDAAVGAGADLPPERAHDLAERVRRALDPSQQQAAGTQSLAGIPVRADLLDMLAPSQHEELAEWLGKGHKLYAALVFLEQSPDVAGRFIQWLQGTARAVTNRTVFEGLATGFEFLLHSEMPPADLRRQLTELDPHGACVRTVTVFTAEGEVAVISPEQRAAEVQAQRGGGEQAAHSVLRVRSEVVDRLVGRIGETLMVVNGMRGEINERAQPELAALRALLDRMPGEQAAQAFVHLDRLADSVKALGNLQQRMDMAVQHLHDNSLDLRVVSLDALFTRLSRVVRDLALSLGKNVRFEVEGREVRIDKTVVEQLASPLTHMVRNAVDHGIETAGERTAAGKPATARFILKASQRGNEITIAIGDDGRGLDDKRILHTAVRRGLVTASEAEWLSPQEIHRMIFLPGFSTAEKITETSGRGVGMDVVLTTVAGLGGRVDIETQLGRGTTFLIRLPLSATLQTALLIGVGDQMLAVPDRHLSEVREVAPAEIETVNGQPGIVLRGSFLPIFRMAALLDFKGTPGAEAATLPLLILSNGASRIGVSVDRLHHRHEMYMKDLHPRLAKIPGIGGATIMGDGRVVLVLDCDGLIGRARQLAQPHGAHRRGAG